MSLRRFLVPIVMSVALIQTSATFAQFQHLVQHLPDDANTLVLFNVEEVLASPLAQKENWRERNEKAFASGLTLVQPQSTRLILVSQMDFELMQPHWHAAVMDVEYEPSMLSVTERYGGTVDRIDGRDAAVLPNNVYVVKFSKSTAGTMFPADRQKTTRWLEEIYADSSRMPLTNYLREAEGYVDKLGTPIILAMDLQHVLSPKFIRDRLESAESLRGKKIDFDQLAAALASIRGVTLGITITDRISGGIKVDFGQDITFLKDLAKPILLEALANHGAMIQEFHDWNAEVGGKTVLLKGPLYQSGMQRICSVLDAPPALHPLQQHESTADGHPSHSQVAQTTKQYFNSIGLLLRDLRSEDRKHETITPGLIAIWYKRYADKIDALPILHVDKDMVQFGADVANALRQSQDAMQSVGVRSSMRIATKPDAAVYSDVSVARAGVGPYGWAAGGGYAYRYNPRASLRAEGEQETRIREQERIRGYGNANQIMQNIEVAMTDMRRKMTEKYQVEF